MHAFGRWVSPVLGGMKSASCRQTRASLEISCHVLANYQELGNTPCTSAQRWVSAVHWCVACCLLPGSWREHVDETFCALISNTPSVLILYHGATWISQSERSERSIFFIRESWMKYSRVESLFAFASHSWFDFFWVLSVNICLT